MTALLYCLSACRSDCLPAGPTTCMLVRLPACMSNHLHAGPTTLHAILVLLSTSCHRLIPCVYACLGVLSDVPAVMLTCMPVRLPACHPVFFYLLPAPGKFPAYMPVLLLCLLYCLPACRSDYLHAIMCFLSTSCPRLITCIYACPASVPAVYLLAGPTTCMPSCGFYPLSAPHNSLRICLSRRPV